MSDVDTLNNNEADLTEFKKLQKRLNHESIKTQFRTKAFGGLHEEDVTRYIEDLEDKFKKLEQENKKASDEVFALRSRLNKELEDKDSLLINLDELRQDVHAYMTECKQKETDINSLKENNSSVCTLMKSDIHNLTQEKQELEKVLNEYYQNIEQINLKLSDLEYKNTQLEKESSQSIIEKEELEGRLALSYNEVLKYKNNIAVFENENNTLRTRVNVLENENLQIPELNNEILKVNEERTMLEKLLNDSDNELLNIKENSASVESEKEALQTKISELNNVIANLQEERTMLEELLSDSNNELLNVKESHASIEREKEALNTKVLELNSEITKLNDERLMLEKLLNDADSEILETKEYVEALESDNNILTAKVSELSEDNKQIDKLKDENKLLSNELKTFEELLYQSNVEYEKIKENAAALEKDNANLNEQIIEIEKTVSAKDYKINEINRVCMDLKNQIEIEKSCSEKLNMDLVIFKQKIASLQDTINEKLQELEAQKNKNEKQELELNKERAALLSYKVNGFKEEFSDMYKKIDNLEYEATEYLKSSSIIQKQLVKEQNRAEKAENDLASLMAMLTGVKDKFSNDQDLFEDEMSQLVEKQEQKRQDSIISLDTFKKTNSN